MSVKDIAIWYFLILKKNTTNSPLCRLFSYILIRSEADWVTHEQRQALKKNKQEIEELSMAIERAQNSGLLAQLDKMCSSSNTVAYPSGANSLLE